MNEKVNTICFFNHWHNGDIFACKGYIQDLIKQLRCFKSFEFVIAHPKSHKLLLDLDAQYKNIIQDSTDFILPNRDTMKSVFLIDETLYINTWIGAYREVFAIGEEHANWLNMNRMWNMIHHMVANILDITIQSKYNPVSIIPSTIWERFEVDHVKKFVEGRNQIALFCNGLVSSSQSIYEKMENIILPLAESNPNVDFVCTSTFDTTVEVPKNVHFTNYIFSEVQDGDLNEIAYLSTFSKLIVGKNSGPYMFCHVTDNIFRKDCSFLSLSDRASDSYPYECAEIDCKYFHHTGHDADKVISIVNRILTGDFPEQKSFVNLPTYII